MAYNNYGSSRGYDPTRDGWEDGYGDGHGDDDGFSSDETFGIPPSPMNPRRQGGSAINCPPQRRGKGFAKSAKRVRVSDIANYVQENYQLPQSGRVRDIFRTEFNLPDPLRAAVEFLSQKKGMASLDQIADRETRTGEPLLPTRLRKKQHDGTGPVASQQCLVVCYNGHYFAAPRRK